MASPRVNCGELERWLSAYERAWRTPGTEVLAELFAEGATYSNDPYPGARRIVRLTRPVRGVESL